MVNLRNELTKAIMDKLGINADPFTVGSIKNCLEPIADDKLQDFYNALFGDEHSFLKPMDRIVKVAKQFQVQTVDRVELKAKEFIKLVHSMNNVVFSNSRTSGRTFEDELAGTTFTNVSERVIAVLNNVAPHFNHKKLIANIRTYSTAVSELTAFKRALTTLREKDTAIASPEVKKMIGRVA